VKKSDELLAKLGASFEKPAPSRPRTTAPAVAVVGPAPEPPPPSESSPPPKSPSTSVAAAAVSRRCAAEEIVDRFVPLAMGAGMVPVPILDLAAISGLQLKLISDLSSHYGVPFAAERTKAVVASLLGGVGSLTLAAGALGSLLKVVPVAGFWMGCTSLSVTAGALTYAVGRVFVDHFESGGTLLDFDAATAKGMLAGKLAEGRAALSRL
jgi:uncharacterized protein (DUF697 family)